MDYFHRIKPYIDYNNSYGLRKILNTLYGEFIAAIKKHNISGATNIFHTTKALYDDFSRSFRNSEDKGNTMSFTQKLEIKRIQNFIGYMTQKLHKEQGLSNNLEKDIKDAIQP